MVRVYGKYKYFHSLSAGSVFGRQILTTKYPAVRVNQKFDLEDVYF